MKRIFIFLLVLGLLYACGTSSDQRADLSLKQTGNYKSITLPESWGQFNLNWKISSSGKILLTNSKLRELIWMKGLDSSTSMAIVFAKDGPDSLGGSIEDVQWGPDETIWIGTSGDKLVQIDLGGNILQRIDLPTESLYEQNISLMNFNFVVKEDGVYFPAFPLVFDWTSLSIDEMHKLPNLLKYEFDTNKFSVLSTYSMDFLGSSLQKNILPMLYAGLEDDIIINHNFKDIYIYSNRQLHTHEMAYSEFSSTPPTSSKNIFEDMDEIMWLLNYSDAYVAILNLPEAGLIARTVKFDEKSEMSSSVQEYVPAKWGIVLADNTYTKVGEYAFPVDAFDPQMIYPDPDGLWVSTTHPNQAELEEGVLTFELLKFKRL